MSKSYGGKDGAIVVDCTDTMELSNSTCVEVTLSTDVNSVTSTNENGKGNYKKKNIFFFMLTFTCRAGHFTSNWGR